MIKIDLHLHSEISKLNGDKIHWPSNLFVAKKLYSKKIKVASFTDHNIFDLRFYFKMKNLCQKAGILLLPGIELNVQRLNGIRSNILYIFSDKLSEIKLEQIEIISRKIGKKGIAIKNVNLIFKDFNPILIPHVGKSDFLGMEDLYKIKYDAIEISSYKNNNYTKYKKHKKLKSSVVAFSDTHLWNHYPELNKLTTKVNIEKISFRSLKIALNQNKNYTYTFLGDQSE